VERSAEIATGAVFLGTIKDAFLPPFGIKKLCGCESFQDRHGCMATWASPKCGCRLSRGLLHQGREKIATKRKQFAPPAIGQPAEVANARETFREDVLYEAAQEFFAGQRHSALFAVVGVVFPPEEHLGFVDHNAVVGDSYAVRVTSQIVQNVFGSAKRWLGINDPIFLKQGVQKCAEGFFFGQRQAVSVKANCLVRKARRNPNTNFPRKTRLRTWTGKKKLMAVEIQCR